MDLAKLEQAVAGAIVIEEQRDLDTDPAFGIEQLATIGWTSISTAKSNPNPGLLAIWNLRDLLARWVIQEEGFGAERPVSGVPRSIVYVDAVPTQLMQAFESLAVIASESMQHQCITEIYRTFAALLPKLPPPMRRQADDLVLRSLSGLGDHILTSDLEAALTALAEAFETAEGSRSASAIRVAQQQFRRTTGQFNSRSTRVDAGQARGPQEK